MEINERIKQYLVENGIKQSFLAKKMNMSKFTMSSLLNGKRKITAEELNDIGKALNVNPTIFLD